MPDFTKTRVVLSFGAAAGGFEFAMELRRNIMAKYGKQFLDDPTFVYLDAESLREDQATRYTWDDKLGIWKMSNEFWKQYYGSAMDNCQYMVFLISEPWLRSNWCWEEFNWYQRIITEKSVAPIFVVFKDGGRILNDGAKVKDSKGGEHDLKPLWQQIVTNPKTQVVDIATDPAPGVGTVEVEGKTYTYTHKYVCSESELSAILGKIVIRV
jgi:hypothetical protein